MPSVAIPARAAYNDPQQWPDPRAAYIHVPFCARRCGYCNFALVAGRDDLIERYLAALTVELSWLGTPREVDTLFLGGGTPTHLPPTALASLLRLARQWFRLAEGYEFSVEANPRDITPDRVAVLSEYGVNRVSLGAQSFRAEKLLSLERDHAPGDIVLACERLRPTVRSLSLDLIFGAPGEALADWRNDVAEALRLEPDHVSTYGLTFERGTTFYGRRLRGELQSIPEELDRALYVHSIEALAGAGYEHYEVSNFARARHRCRHNETYWNADGYYAAGPGAARYVDGIREVNHRGTINYLRRIEEGRSPVAERESLSAEDRAREALVLGLRRMDGIEVRAFAARFGCDVAELGGTALCRHIDEGLLRLTSNWLRLTREGLLVSDSLWPAYLRT